MIWYSQCLCFYHSPCFVLLHVLVVFWCSGLTLLTILCFFILSWSTSPSNILCMFCYKLGTVKLDVVNSSICIYGLFQGFSLLLLCFVVISAFYSDCLHLNWAYVAFAFLKGIKVSVFFQTVQHGSLRSLGFNLLHPCLHLIACYSVCIIYGCKFSYNSCYHIIIYPFMNCSLMFLFFLYICTQML